MLKELHQHTTPEAATDLRHVRIVQPHHPLRGQIVKVLRNGRRPHADEPCWLIETDAGARQLVPQAWCRAVEDSVNFSPIISADLPPVHVTILRQLAIMVCELSRKEETHHVPVTLTSPAVHLTPTTSTVYQESGCLAESASFPAEAGCADSGTNPCQGQADGGQP